MFCTSPLIACMFVIENTTDHLDGYCWVQGGEVLQLTLPSSSPGTHTLTAKQTHTHTHRHQFSFGEMSWSVDGCGRLSLTDAGPSLSPSVGSAPPSATGR